MDIGVSDEVMNHLTNRHWKGNVRELENVIARACILSGGSVITMSHLDEGRPVPGECGCELGARDGNEGSFSMH